MDITPPKIPVTFSLKPFQWRTFKLVLRLYLAMLTLQSIIIATLAQKQPIVMVQVGQIAFEVVMVVSLLVWIHKGPSQAAVHVFFALITTTQVSATFLSDPLLSVLLFSVVVVILSVAFSLLAPPQTALVWSIIIALSVGSAVLIRMMSPSNPLGWSATQLERLQHHIYTSFGLMIAAAFLVRWFTREFYQVATQGQALAAALQQNNQTLEQTRDVALQAAKTKSLLLENVSHELRTPLNAIIGYAALASEHLAEKDTPDIEQLQHDLGKIDRAGNHLLSLVQQVLDLTSLERGNTALQPNICSLDDLCQKLSARFRPEARRNGNTFVTQIDPMPGTIETDQAQLEKLLGLLLENACKFTQGGHVTLGFARKAEDELVITIKDDGIGMMKGQIERAFEPFEQLDMSKAKQHQGLGIGLPLAAQLATLLQGQLDVQSTPGEGSTFQLTLPTTLLRSAHS